MGASDLIILAVVILAAGFSLVIGNYVWTSFSTGLNNTIGDVSTTSETITNVTTAFNMFDTLFVMLQLGLMIGVVVSFFYLDSHPIYFFFSLFLLAFALILGAQFSNMWFELGQMSQLNATMANYPQGDWLMDNMPLLLLVTGLIGLAVLYGKTGGGRT